MIRGIAFDLRTDDSFNLQFDCFFVSLCIAEFVDYIVSTVMSVANFVPSPFGNGFIFGLIFQLLPKALIFWSELEINCFSNPSITVETTMIILSPHEAFESDWKFIISFKSEFDLTFDSNDPDIHKEFFTSLNFGFELLRQLFFGGLNSGLWFGNRVTDFLAEFDFDFHSTKKIQGCLKLAIYFNASFGTGSRALGNIDLVLDSAFDDLWHLDVSCASWVIKL